LAILDDTIAAVSTPAGASAVGIVRLSGPAAFPILQSLLAESGGGLASLPPYSALETALRLRPGGPRVPATLYLMRAPRSYTRQDIAEIHTVGSAALLRVLLDALVERGARVAEPGEFTRRAFLAGRIDLAQAEAVLAVIQSTTANELRAATRALGGHPSRHIRRLHDTLLALRARVEASIDFAEHDIELISPRELCAAVSHALADVSGQLQGADAGALPPEGIRVALCGLPNAGKSSLFNALLGRDRAIVTPVPGTTRDAIAEPLVIEGVRFRLYDTAGIPSEGSRTPPEGSNTFGRVTGTPASPAHPASRNPGGGSEASSCGRAGEESGVVPPHSKASGRFAAGRGPDGGPPEPSELDAVDIEAIARSRGLIAGTHIALVVLDATQPLGEGERELWSEIQAPHRLLVLNKSDLPSGISDAEAVTLSRPDGPPSGCPVLDAPASISPPPFLQTEKRDAGASRTRHPHAGAWGREEGVPTPERGDEQASPSSHASRITHHAWPLLRVSALTGAGVSELKAALAALVRSGRVDASPADLTWNARHRQALRRAREAIERALAAAADALGAEFVAADLRDAHDALGAITGQIVAEDLLDLIFAQFCIGK